MEFEHSARSIELQHRVRDFMDRHVMPVEK
jgi:hypothetical protein